MPILKSAVIALAALSVATTAFAPASLLTSKSSLKLSASVVNGDAYSYTYNPNNNQNLQPTVAAVPKVAQRWRKSTKQVVTLGPASSSVEMIEKLFLAGADMFRLNFSHGSQEQKKELLDMIRSVEEKYSHPIAILGDLQGPKLRVRTRESLRVVP